MNSSYQYDIFISYKSEDLVWVQQLRQDLKERGVRVWGDQNQLRPVDEFPEALKNGVQTSRSVGLVVTPASLAEDWVKCEYDRALSLATKRQLQIIPLLLPDAELPDGLSRSRYVDFRNPDRYESNVDHLVWPSITDQYILAYAAETSHWEPWEKLKTIMHGMGIGYSGFSGLGRVEEMMTCLRFGDEHFLINPRKRVAVILDLFDYWPGFDEHCNRDNVDLDLIKLRIQRLFEIRGQTKYTPYELVFVLYQHSQVWDKVKPYLDKRIADRLDHYYKIEGDLDAVTLKRNLRKTWNRVQGDFLQADFLRTKQDQRVWGGGRAVAALAARAPGEKLAKAAKDLNTLLNAPRQEGPIIASMATEGEQAATKEVLTAMDRFTSEAKEQPFQCWDDYNRAIDNGTPKIIASFLLAVCLARGLLNINITIGSP